MFETLAEAEFLAADYRDDCTATHHDSALRMISPSRFAGSWQRIREQDRPVNPELLEGVDR